MLIGWSAHRRALTEAQVWCEMYLNEQKPALSLRSKMLRPADYPEAWIYSQLHPSALEQLVAKRRELVSENQLSARPAGRILVIEGDADAYTGEGVPASAGVIDDT
ncbi:hypothetical protein [Deinococcus sp.]|uniref:hypothetical protein n=1 Tax=Deinococcus sp. TaxID=47478 RepID=UPI003B5AEAAC